MIKRETINDCTLYHGDCLEVMPTLSAVDMVLADVPYGTTACKWDSIIPLDRMWSCLNNVVRDNTPIVMTASQPFTSALGYSNIKHLKYSWCWIKSRATGHLNAKKMPMKNYEDILVFYKKQPRYDPQNVVKCDLIQHNSKSHFLRGKATEPSSVVSGGIDYKPYSQTTTNYPRLTIEFNSEGKTFHPTQKPVALMEYLIKTYTNEGDTVLDFTMGSGTTGVACVNTNRKFIGVELDANYYNIAKNRINDALSELQK